MNLWQSEDEIFQITGLVYSKDLSPRVLLPILGTSEYLRDGDEENLTTQDAKFGKSYGPLDFGYLVLIL